MFLTKYRFTNTLILCIILVVSAAGCNTQPQVTIEPLVTIDVPTISTLEPTPTAEQMAIMVNGEGISLIEFDQEMHRYQDGLTNAGVALPEESEQKNLVTLELTNQLLLKQGAVEKGFSLSSEDVQVKLDELVSNLGGLDVLKSWQVVNFYTEETFMTAFERSIYSTWMRDEIVVKVPTTAEQVHVQQIRVQSEGAARSVIAELEAGADFATLAQEYDPITKGDLGWSPLGYLTQAAIDEAAFTLEPGEVSQLIQTEIGFHIIQVIEKDSNHELTPDALLFMQKQALANWLEQKRNDSEIVERK